MKKSLFFTVLIIIILLSSLPLFPQDLTVFNSIGKKQSEIIKTFGKPAHIDNSIPSMICIFYKSPSIAFVADESGVYQVEIIKKFQSEKELNKDLTNCIKKSLAAGFSADTVSANNIFLRKPGVMAEVVILNNNDTFELKIEAKRRE